MAGRRRLALRGWPRPRLFSAWFAWRAAAKFAPGLGARRRMKKVAAPADIFRRLPLFRLACVRMFFWRQADGACCPTACNLPIALFLAVTWRGRRHHRAGVSPATATRRRRRSRGRGNSPRARLSARLPLRALFFTAPAAAILLNLYMRRLRQLLLPVWGGC